MTTPPPATAPRPPVLRGVARQTVAVDLRALRGWSAVRPAIGVVVPLAVGVAVHQEIVGVEVVVGALSVGFTSTLGANRGRLLAAVLASVGMAVSTTVATLDAGHPWLAVPVVMVWAFVAGLAVGLGQTALVVAQQAVVALLVLGEFAAPLPAALERGGYVLAGGLVQVGLLLATLPLGRYRSERATLGAAFDGLAGYAAAVAAGDSALPDPALLADTRATMADPQLLGGSQEATAFVRLADETERIRLSLVALGRLIELAPAVAGPLRSLADGSAQLLAALALASRSGQPPSPAGQVWSRLDEVAGRLCQPGSVALIEDDAAQRARALLGQLRTCTRLLRIAQGESEPVAATPAAQSGPGRTMARNRWRGLLPVREAAHTVRGSLSASSPVLRHAIRLAVVLAVAVTAYHLLPIPHGYWLPLTALVVLRPDFATTLTRGASRILGTLLGAALATLLASLLRPGPVVLTVLVGVFVLLGYALIQASYTLFAACITSLVVFLLAFTKLPELTAVGDRALDTVLGGLLALLAYVVWPSWQVRAVPRDLAALLRAQASYVGAVLEAYVHPDHFDRTRLRELRSRARRARGSAEATLAGALAEPARTAPIDTATAVGMMAAVRGLVAAALTLQARLLTAPPQPQPELAELATQVPATLRGLADSAETAHPPTGLPDLRAAQVRLADQVLRLRARSGGPAALDAALLLTETDLMVDSINAAAELLAGARAPEPPTPAGVPAVERPAG